MTSQSFSRDSGSSREISFQPVNVRMIRTIMGKGLPFMLGSYPIEHVVLVARLKSYVDGACVMMEFQDETGSIGGVLYKGNRSKNIRPLADFSPRIGEYVSCLGILMKNGQGHDSITVDKLINIQDYKSIVLHRVQIVWAHQVRSQILHFSSSYNQTAENLESRLEDADEFKNLSEQQRAIMKCLKNRNPSQGILVDDIMVLAKLPKEVVADNLKQRLEYGFVYSTDCRNYFMS